MRRYCTPSGADPAIVSGESGAAGLGALLALMTSGERAASILNQLGLGPDSRVLLLNTEGDTDPEHYQLVVSTLKKPF
jgi:diaminopropionate ammonia-lyase